MKTKENHKSFSRVTAITLFVLFAVTITNSLNAQKFSHVWAGGAGAWETAANWYTVHASSTSVTAAASATSITLGGTNTGTVAVNDYVAGFGIVPGTYVATVNSVTSIVLSTGLYAAISGQGISFYKNVASSAPSGTAAANNALINSGTCTLNSNVTCRIAVGNTSATNVGKLVISPTYTLTASSAGNLSTNNVVVVFGGIIENNGTLSATATTATNSYPIRVENPAVAPTVAWGYLKNPSIAAGVLSLNSNNAAVTSGGAIAFNNTNTLATQAPEIDLNNSTYITPSASTGFYAINMSAGANGIIGGTGLTLGTDVASSVKGGLISQGGSNSSLTINAGTTLSYFSNSLNAINGIFINVTASTPTATFTNKGNIYGYGTSTTAFMKLTDLYITPANTLKFDNQGTITSDMAISAANFGILNVATGGASNVAIVQIENSGIMTLKNTQTNATSIGNALFCSTSNPTTVTINNSGTLGFDGTNVAWGGTPGKTTINNTGTVNVINSIVDKVIFNNNSGGILDCKTNNIKSDPTYIVTINTGSTLKTAGLGGLTTSITGTNAVFSSGANYLFNGSGAQTTGAALTAANNIEINNAAGVTLSAVTTVNGTLTLNSGLLNPSTYSLALGSAGSISGASATKYINGALSKIYGATGSMTFPIGAGGNYRPVTINATSLDVTPSTFTVSQTESALSGTMPANTTLYSARNWTVAQTGSTMYNYNLTLDGTGFTPTGSAKIIENNAETITSNSITGTYTASGLTSVGSFGLGDYVAPVAPTITFASVTINKTYGEAVSTPQSAGSNSAGSITYESATTSVATIDANTGELTIVGAGSSIITATQAASGSYSAGSTFYTVNVGAKALTVTSPIVTTKTYTSTNAAVVTGTLNGILNSDAVTLTGTGTFADVNVANGIPVTSTSTLGGAKAGNYTLTQPIELTGNITAKALSITEASIASKVYDGSATSGTVTAGTLSGFVTGAVVSVATAVGTYADANVNTSKSAIIVYTLANGTGLATNYSLADGSANGAITAKALSIAPASIASKVYDGSAASGTVTAGTLSGFVTDAVVSVATAVGTYADATVGTNKQATIVYTLADGTGLATNYSLADGSANGDITSATINIIGTKTAADLTSSTADVTISGASTVLTMDNSKTVKNLTLSDGAEIKLSGANTLTVNGNLDLKADLTTSISLNLGSSSVSVPTGTFRYLKTMNDTKWYFITFPCAVPIAQIQAIGGTAGALTTEWFIKYYNGQRRADSGADGSNWIALTDNTASLEANKGYIFGLATNDGSVKEIAFPLNKTILSNEASRSTITISQNNGTATAPNHGWNLSGQPYLSKYDVTGAGVDYIYFVKPGGTGYDYYLKAFDGSKIVDPFTSYFVQYTNSTSVTFSTGLRQVKSLVNTDITDKLQINFSSISGTDRTNIIMDNNLTSDYVVGQDLEKWLGAASSIYTVLGGVNYALNSLPLTSVNNLPLAYYTQLAGAASISVNAAQTPGLSHLILTDNDNNGVKTSTDLLLTPYNFTAAAGTTTGRFSISAQKISTAIAPISYENDANSALISIVDGRLVLANVANNTTVRVYDALGRMMISKNANSNTLEIKLNARGIYTVQLQNGGSITSRKVIF